MPNVIADRSIANEPSSAGLRRTKRSPSPIDRRIDRRSPASCGSCGDRATTAPTIARQLTASAAYAASTPAALISSPPSPGPSTIVS